MEISLNELENAINYWRTVKPSTGEERALSPEVNLLASVYATMIFHRQKVLTMDTLDASTKHLMEIWRKQCA